MKKVLLTVALAGLTGAVVFAQDSTHVRHKATTVQTAQQHKTQQHKTQQHKTQQHKTQQHKMMKKTRAHKAHAADSSQSGK